MKLRCKFCGKEITRKRGNLRMAASLRKAIESLHAKHERKCGALK